MPDVFTPNSQLTLVDFNTRNWHDKMNNNLRVIDAQLGAFFVVTGLEGVWENSLAVIVDNTYVDTTDGTIWKVLVAHTTAATGTFTEDRDANPGNWELYNAAARNRGTWQSGVDYALNDFVIDSSRYAICISTHVSGGSFDADLALNKWEVIVDGTVFTAQALPALAGAGDADKFTVTNPGGTAYIIVGASTARTLLGATSIGTSLFTAASQAAGRAAINAEVVGAGGANQPLDDGLTTLSGFSSAGLVKSLAGTPFFEVLSISANVETFLGAATYAAMMSQLSAAGLALSNVFTVNQTIRRASALVRSGLDIDNVAATFRTVAYQTSAVDRWHAGINTTAETGSNAGSNYVIRAFADNGAHVGDYLTIVRSSGMATFSGVIVGNDSVFTLDGEAFGWGAGTTYIQGSSAGSVINAFLASALNMTLTGGGGFYLPLLPTTAAAANCVMDNASSPANQFLRSTSSIRYKTDVVDVDVEQATIIVRGLRAINFKSTASHDDPEHVHYGFIAEEVAVIEPSLVNFTYRDEDREVIETPQPPLIVKQESRNEDGEIVLIDVEKPQRPIVEHRVKEGARMVPDGVQYDRIVVAHNAVLKHLLNEIETLKAEIVLLANK